MAARELGQLSLDDALRLSLPLAEHAPPRFDRAALRWLERYIAERLPPLAEIALAATAFAEVRYGDRQTGGGSPPRVPRPPQARARLLLTSGRPLASSPRAGHLRTPLPRPR